MEFCYSSPKKPVNNPNTDDSIIYVSILDHLSSRPMMANYKLEIYKVLCLVKGSTISGCRDMDPTIPTWFIPSASLTYITAIASCLLGFLIYRVVPLQSTFHKVPHKQNSFSVISSYHLLYFHYSIY